MKIKAINPKISNTKLIVPIDGVINVDTEGVAEVSAKCAVQLVNNTSDWEYFKSGSEEVEDEQEDETEQIEEHRSELKDQLDEMKLSEMKEMAEEAGLPEEEWKKLGSKKLMSAYLLKKFDKAVELEDEEEEDEE